MKIGAFAAKFGIKQVTIRYYVKKGLLNPIKKRTYYEYNQTCVEDMEKILRLKRMNFTLDEIAMYLAYLRLNYSRTFSSKREIMDLLRKKMRSVDASINELMAAREEIQQLLQEVSEMVDIPRHESPGRGGIGFPVAFTKRLICPDCQKPLSLNSDRIVNNDVISGDLRCDCGYTATIKDGVVTFEGSTNEDFYEGKPAPIQPDQNYSPAFINTAYSAVDWLKEQVSSEPVQNRTVLNPAIQEGQASFKLLSSLLQRRTDFTFIGIDPSLAFIRNFQHLLATNTRKPENTLLFSGSVDRAPLPKESVDYITMSCGLQYHRLFHGTNPADLLVKLLKPGGKWFELFFCVDDRRLINEQYRPFSDVLHCPSLQETFSKQIKANFIKSGEVTEKSEFSKFFKETANGIFCNIIGQKAQRNE